jgi:hypothetical protein
MASTRCGLAGRNGWDFLFFSDRAQGLSTDLLWLELPYFIPSSLVKSPTLFHFLHVFLQCVWPLLQPLCSSGHEGTNTAGSVVGLNGGGPNTNR